MFDEHGQQDKERGVSRAGRVFGGKVRNKEPYSVAVSLLYLAVGVGAVWFVRSVVGVRGDATLVAFLVVPLALYLMLSGRVSEIAAGSLDVKLREAGRERAAQAWTEALAVADDVLMFDLQDNWSVKVKVNPNWSQIATLTLGGALEVTALEVTEASADGPADVKTVRRKYERESVLASLRTAAAEHRVPVVLLLDEYRRVVAYLTYPSAVDLFENGNHGDRFIELVNAGDPRAFDGPARFSGVRTELPSVNVTNVEALETMEKTGIDVLVVVTRKGVFGGIVERERVLSRMMLALASSPSAK